jgi:ferric-dicitrate binding protein FerR (iron transport regulator)
MSETSITFDDFSSSKRRQRRLTIGAGLMGLIFAVWIAVNVITIEATEAVSPNNLAKVTRKEGKVMIKRGAETVEFEPDMYVLAGDAFITMGTAELEVAYLDDGTKALLGSDTSLLFNGNAGGKKTNLSSGTVRFEIQRQPDGSPMVLASYNAEAVVLEPGIYFQTYTNAGTRFDVEEGSLVARRYSDGQTDTVAAGETHTCSTDETETIQFRPDGLK